MDVSGSIVSYHWGEKFTRLMALAIHFDGLIQSGAVANYAELARLGNVTRARMTQIMNLLIGTGDSGGAFVFAAIGTGAGRGVFEGFAGGGSGEWVERTNSLNRNLVYSHPQIPWPIIVPLPSPVLFEVAPDIGAAGSATACQDTMQRHPKVAGIFYFDENERYSKFLGLRHKFTINNI